MPVESMTSFRRIILIDKPRSRRPIQSFQRHDALGLSVGCVVMLNERSHHVIQCPHRQRNRGSVSLVLGVFAKASRTHIEASIILVSTTQEAANLLATHLPFTVLNLHNDTWVLETEAVRRGNDVLASIGTRWRDLSLVAHCAKDSCYELLHVIPIQLAYTILDTLQCLSFNICQRVSNAFLGLIFLRHYWLAFQRLKHFSSGIGRHFEQGQSRAQAILGAGTQVIPGQLLLLPLNLAHQSHALLCPFRMMLRLTDHLTDKIQAVSRRISNNPITDRDLVDEAPNLRSTGNHRALFELGLKLLILSSELFTPNTRRCMRC
ncbi:hypothetical protein AXW98_11565 [Pseudomonas aeruginosa]|nr:hypothetical protein AXW98_11565 [Pseudomonas aeruginosa]